MSFASTIVVFQAKYNLTSDDCAAMWDVSRPSVERWINEETVPRRIVKDFVLHEIEHYIDPLKELIKNATERNIGSEMNVVELAKLCGYSEVKSIYKAWWDDKPHQILHRVLALYVLEKKKNGP
jgi:predicted DNA-binding transcriptional regulator AlpA